MIVITIGASILAFGLAYGLSKLARFDEGKLSQPHNDLITVGVQIICGNCCGEAESPRKTYLDRSGNCSQCGGRSYILASTRIVYAQQIIDSRLSRRDTGPRQHPDVSTRLHVVRSRAMSA
ncbi:MAG TPA: hypothetical protein VKN18_10280 [Blastocatellia bacterium]|nr:hypothetical protein [Blastocatellia bacterium]